MQSKSRVGLTFLLLTGKLAAGKKAKVTVRRSQFRFLRAGVRDVMLSAVPDLSRHFLKKRQALRILRSKIEGRIADP
jgi:hypothetical protein